MLKNTQFISLLSVSFAVLASSQNGFAASVLAFKEIKILDCHVDYPEGPNPSILVKGKTVKVRAEGQAHLELYLRTNGKFVSTLRGSFTTPVLKWEDDQVDIGQNYMPSFFSNINRTERRGEDENTSHKDVQVSSVSQKRNPWGASTKSIVIGLSSEARITMSAEDGNPNTSQLGQIVLDQENGADGTLVSLADRSGARLSNVFGQELSFFIPSNLGDMTSTDKCAVQNYKILKQLAAQ